MLCSVRCVSVSIVVDLTDNWSGIFINISRHNSAKVFVGGWELSGVCKLHQTLLSAGYTGPYWAVLTSHHISVLTLNTKT